MRICKYRNCKSEVKGRPNKLYCNRKCKTNESKYIFRENKKGRTKIEERGDSRKNLEKSNLPNRAPIDNIVQRPTGPRGIPGPPGMTRNEYRAFKLKKIFKKL